MSDEFINIPIKKFDWKTYIEINNDLKLNGIKTKEEAYRHWVNHGISEERSYSFINNSNIHNGRFGNLFFVNMVLHFLSIKYNLKCRYKYYDKFNKLGIYLNKGEKKYKTSIEVNDNNFLSLIKNETTINHNIILNNNSWFQKKEFCDYLKDYFYIKDNKYKIINNNKYKNRYKKNNDVFIHVRLGDIVDKINGVYNYFDKILSEISFKNGYISSDSINNEICKDLIKKYSLKVINKDEISTIMFASTCNNLVLSGGTFSWLMGFLAFYSRYIYYPKLQNTWYDGDIFSFPNWKEVVF
jgi:hypothetical protein